VIRQVTAESVRSLLIQPGIASTGFIESGCRRLAIIRGEDIKGAVESLLSNGGLIEYDLSTHA